MRGSRRFLTRSLVVLATLWGATVVVLVVLSARRLDAGADRLDHLRDDLDLASLSDGEAEREFREAADDFGDADSYLQVPLLAPVRLLPVAGRHLDAVRSLTRSAADVSSAAATAAGDAADLVGEPPGVGAQRVQVLQQLRAVIGRARASVARADLGPGNLVEPLASRRARFARELADARATLEKADAGLGAATAILAGPRRHLLLVSSNAEMRAGSGMFLSAGVLDSADGDLSLGAMQATGDLTLDEGVPYVDPDLEARWGALEPNREFRNLALSPRFPANARLAADMWERRTGDRVDGVLALDVEAVRALLDATGPVTIGERSVAGDDLVEFLLHDQYVESGAELGGSQEARRDELGSIAEAIVAAIEGGEFEVGDLADGLAGAVSGRHLLAWSRDTATQEVWSDLGVSGDMAGDSLLVALSNRGANKLDPFLGVEASVERHGRTLRVTVAVDNRTQPGEIAYIAGPNPATGTSYGEYKGIVAVTLPGYAGDIAIEGVSPVAVAGADGPTNVVGGEIRVPGGGSARVVVEFTAPPGTALSVLPSARIPPITWRSGDSTWTDVEPRTIRP